MKKMPIERARPEIDDGIASVTAALGDSAPAPFFRIPGLSRAEDVEDYVASKGIQTWSADFLADDWRHVSSTRVFELAIKRLEARGRGILLLHDIQARTVAALPRILREMKSRGYRIVHVVPATPERPATPTEPQQWQLHPASETVATSHWPTVPGFVFTKADTLPAPALSDLDWQSPQPAGGAAPSRAAAWPAHQSLPQNSAAIALPVPASSVFEIREKRGTAAQEYIPSPLHTERTVTRHHETVGVAKAAAADASGSRHAIPGSPAIIPSRLGAAPAGTR
jgi:hypothetical protein